MAFDYWIIDTRRLVLAVANGRVTDQDLFGYQLAAWASESVHGYDELIDMSNVTEVVQPSKERLSDLAKLATSMSASNVKSRLAIIATADLVFGLARMFQTMRDLEGGSEREVMVTRSASEAFLFLKIDPGMTIERLLAEAKRKDEG